MPFDQHSPYFGATLLPLSSASSSSARCTKNATRLQASLIIAQRHPLGGGL